MFASLSSFIPSALQQVSISPASAQKHVIEPTPTPTPAPPPPPPPPEPSRKKEKKEKHANEAFIIVRPPPSKSTQPLSLQVQLVPPQSRHERPVQALDTSPDDLDTDLRRTHSNRSETSTHSSGSVTSFTSSTSTSSSGRRMIIPLYNLNVHSVMPTTILDAGTDARVAKFAKRGLEVIGLAFLEPIEVRPSFPANGSLAPSVTTRTSLDGSLREFGAASSSRRTVSPDRPNTSHGIINAPTINLTPAPPLPPPDAQPQRSNKFFTKIFRKKETPSPLSVVAPLPGEDVPPQPSPALSTARRSYEASIPHPDISHHDPWSSTALSSTAASQTVVFGVHSTLYPPVSNPKGRPTKYVWIVRKWLKGAESSILNGVMGKLGAASRDVNAPSAPHIEVRFEWSRGQKKGSRKAEKHSNLQERYSPTRQQTPRAAPQMLSPASHDHRRSVISQHSSGSDTATSLASSAHRHAEESEDESDPEDSETPWTCTVAAQRLRHEEGERESAIRLKVATLAPTPHHPKVVGLLKMPFPLPDIEVEHLVIRPRHVTAQGINKTTTPNTGEFVLSAEEIKDTVSSTALWLVVREAFGGVGIERKKGKP